MKYLAALALLTCCAYLPSLAGQPVYEDTNILPALSQPFAWDQVLQPRSVILLSYRLTGADPFIGHLFSVSVHLVNGLLLWLWASALVGDLSLLIVAIFWLHPLQTESVAYLTGRGELLACLGLLTTLVALTRLSGGLRAFLVAFAGLFALGAKEASVVGLLIGLACYTGQWPAWFLWNGLALSFADKLPHT